METTRLSPFKTFQFVGERSPEIFSTIHRDRPVASSRLTSGVRGRESLSSPFVAKSFFPRHYTAIFPYTHTTNGGIGFLERRNSYVKHNRYLGRGKKFCRKCIICSQFLARSREKREEECVCAQYSLTVPRRRVFSPLASRRRATLYALAVLWKS